jgi:4-hydroxy-2-oxoheptanedioate aldolase
VVGSEPRTTLERLLAGAGSRPLIGSNLISGGPEWMELCGNAGFDFVCVDQMVSAMSWQETNEMLRAATAGRTSGWVRLSAYPWGGDDQRAFLRRDVLKAIAIGAEAILASVDNAQDAAALVEMPEAHVRHRKYAVRGRDAEGIVPAGLPSIIPLVESDNALATLTQFTSIAGLEAVFMGVGDLARLKGVAADVRDPKMASVLRDAVKVCSQMGVTVMCSTGRSDTLDEIQTSVDMLWGIGVKVIWVANPAHIAFKFYRTIMDRIR